jgi:hypothetical protein
MIISGIKNWAKKLFKNILIPKEVRAVNIIKHKCIENLDKGKCTMEGCSLWKFCSSCEDDDYNETIIIHYHGRREDYEKKYSPERYIQRVIGIR